MRKLEPEVAVCGTSAITKFVFGAYLGRRSIYHFEPILIIEYRLRRQRDRVYFMTYFRAPISSIVSRV